MVTPANNIGFSNVNTELGRSASTANTDLNFLHSYVHDGSQTGTLGPGNQRSTYPTMGEMLNKYYYQSTNKQNCNNGNCTNNNCNCGNIQCANCTINGRVNCQNCDGRAWLQNNCNCNCTFNCNYTYYSFNCNCACNC